MPKRIFLSWLIAIATAFPAVAQDWAPFPMGQSSFFADTASDPLEVDMYLMDSVQAQGNDTVLLFKWKLREQLFGACANGFVPPHNYWNDATNQRYPMDSLVLHQDTVFFHTSYSSSPFYFLPHAAVGQSWTVSSDDPGTNFGQESITCVSAGLENIPGAGPDSVKVFSMQPDSAYRFVLSKSYGFLAMVPFMLFQHQATGEDFRQYRLIGRATDDAAHGYRQPDFSDYFHLHPGDLRWWKITVDPPDPIQPDQEFYQLDSITDAVITDDSVTYTFDFVRTLLGDTVWALNGATRTYRRSVEGKLLGAAPNDLAIAPDALGSPQPDLWSTSRLRIRPSSPGTDTITAFAFFSSQGLFPLDSCTVDELIDAFPEYAFDTRTGVTKECTYWLLSSGGFSCKELLGSRVDGVVDGDITLGIPPPGTVQRSPVLYPVPATERLHLAPVAPYRGVAYTVRDGLGREVLKGRVDGTGIPVADLPAGIYLLRLQARGDMVTHRFVKE